MGAASFHNLWWLPTIDLSPPPLTLHTRVELYRGVRELAGEPEPATGYRQPHRYSLISGTASSAGG